MIHKPGFKERWKWPPDILLITAGVCEKQSGFSLCRKDSSSSGSSPSLCSNNKDNIKNKLIKYYWDKKTCLNILREIFSSCNYNGINT